jgi:cell wall assembly regulator SMI1
MIPVKLSNQSTPVVLCDTGPQVFEDTIAAFEAKLGCKLPQDYREFLLRYNGGTPAVGTVTGRDDRPDIPYQHGDAIRTFFKLLTPGANQSGHDELKIIEHADWPLPKSQLPIAEDGGGNFFALDLRSPTGVIRFINHEALDEPIKRHRVMADSFLELLLRVMSVEENEALEQARRSQDRKRIERGRFPKRLARTLAAVSPRWPDAASWCRALSLKLFDAKGHFSVHDDDLSRLLLDFMFWLNENARNSTAVTPRTELAKIVYDWFADDDEGFGLTGYAPDFVDAWWKDRLQSGIMDGSYAAARLTAEAAAAVPVRLLRELAT